ncbi:hypothetical protein B4109_2595 [Geobacillus stearothermophilus]|uniref:Uncharacterized protein n=1 Tax=Geobacillus stearothermophilus TaxID=1422 RepID=A0A150MCQ0_GEOSE|nr:hypothetical protein B4109_2595 [Geobacillus stearothermophilus]
MAAQYAAIHHRTVHDPWTERQRRPQQLLGRNRQQPFAVARTDASLIKNAFGHRHRGLRRTEKKRSRTALQHGAPKQPAGLRKRQQHADARRSGRFTENRDVVRITTKRRNVLLHPAQRRHLVQNAEIPGLRVRFAERITEMQKAKHVHSVVDRHDNDIAVFRERRPVIPRRRTRTEQKGAAVNPKQHRALLPIRRRRPNVQVQPVFARRLAHPPEQSAENRIRRLHHDRTERCRLPHPIPRIGRLRRQKPALTDRRFRVRNSFPNKNAFIHFPAQPSVPCFNNGSLHPHTS